MNFIRYFFGKKMAVYAAFSVIFGAIITLVSASVTLWDVLKLFLCALVYLWLIRTADDYSDYEKDRQRKKLILNRKQLQFSEYALSAAYILLNIAFFGVYGAISAIFALYVPLMEKAELLKPLLLPVISAYYLRLFSDVSIFSNTAALIYLTLCLAAAIFFSFYKRSKRQ